MLALALILTPNKHTCSPLIVTQ